MGKIGSFKLQIFCSNQNALELKVYNDKGKLFSFIRFLNLIGKVYF
jgi:hypothetical protein